jgi:uncharacterized membrane protein
LACGIGLREQLHYLLFGSLGVSKELAVGISLIVFSQFLVLRVLGGLVWLRQRDSASLADIAAAQAPADRRRLSRRPRPTAAI